MAAGLPGVGLSGAFFIVSAIVAVPLELVRTVRGHSTVARWVEVLRHSGLAIVMLASLELFYAALRLALAQPLHRLPQLTHGVVVGGHAASRVQLKTMPVLPVLATLGLVACVIGLAKGAELISRASDHMPASRRTEDHAG